METLSPPWSSQTFMIRASGLFQRIQRLGEPGGEALGLECTCRDVLETSGAANVEPFAPIARKATKGKQRTLVHFHFCRSK